MDLLLCLSMYFQPCAHVFYARIIERAIEIHPCRNLPANSIQPQNAQLHLLYTKPGKLSPSSTLPPSVILVPSPNTPLSRPPCIAVISRSPAYGPPASTPTPASHHLISHLQCTSCTSPRPHPHFPSLADHAMTSATILPPALPTHIPGRILRYADRKIRRWASGHRNCGSCDAAEMDRLEICPRLSFGALGWCGARWIGGSVGLVEWMHG